MITYIHKPAVSFPYEIFVLMYILLNADKLNKSNSDFLVEEKKNELLNLREWIIKEENILPIYNITHTCIYIHESLYIFWCLHASIVQALQWLFYVFKSMLEKRSDYHRVDPCSLKWTLLNDTLSCFWRIHLLYIYIYIYVYRIHLLIIMKRFD